MRPAASAALALWLAGAGGARAAEPLIADRTHPSQVLGETRNYRIFLPPAYGDSGKRYPVIYWFHGWDQRFNRPGRDGVDPDQGSAYGGDTIAAYVAGHDVIVVKWDGYNPRTPEEKYPRPYNVSPVETHRQFALYFPELVEYIDAHYRTVADREHRATTGYSMGGFMSFWIAGKFPDLVGSASAFMPSTEFYAGPRGFDAEYRHEEMRMNYEGVRLRLITGARDFIRFYHRRLDAVWKWTLPWYQREEFDVEHSTPGIAKTFEFHLKAFANPLPRPAVWSHADVFPYFQVWGWEVATDRRQPGFTVIENVSRTGFKSYVREWLPGGATLEKTKVTVTTPKLFEPSSAQTVTVVRVRDGKVHRLRREADEEGRLTVELDGGENEVGFGTAAVPSLAAWRVEEPYATARKPVHVSLRFVNKGGARSAPLTLKWESPYSSVTFGTPNATLPALLPGRSAEVPFALTLLDETREVVRVNISDGLRKYSVEIPFFADAPVARNLRIADGGAVTYFWGAIDKRAEVVGKGNGNGRASRGETFAVFIPDAGAFRALELFSNDSCVDLSARVSDVWSAYDHVGASAKFTLATVLPDCAPGHVIRMMGRVQAPDKPDHRLQYYAVEVPLVP